MFIKLCGIIFYTVLYIIVSLLFLVPGVIGNLQAIEIIKIIVGLKRILDKNKLYNGNVFTLH